MVILMFVLMVQYLIGHHGMNMKQRWNMLILTVLTAINTSNNHVIKGI